MILDKTKISRKSHCPPRPIQPTQQSPCRARLAPTLHCSRSWIRSAQPSPLKRQQATRRNKIFFNPDPGPSHVLDVIDCKSMAFHNFCRNARKSPPPHRSSSIHVDGSCTHATHATYFVPPGLHRIIYAYYLLQMDIDSTSARAFLNFLRARSYCQQASFMPGKPLSAA